MPILPIIFLGLLQGITEFLPISSSAHLILAPYLLNFENQGLVIDVFLHIGTLLAVIIYFRRDVFEYIRSIPKLLDKTASDETKDLKNLIVATIPIATVGGIIFLTGLTSLLRNLQVIGFATIFFALLLYFVDFRKDTSFRLSNLNLKKILIIGCSQVLAIIPGTSRAGIIYTTCRFYKTSRIEAAKFSMLLSIPTILLSTSIPLIEIAKNGSFELTINAMVAMSVAFIVAMLSINFLLKWVASHTMLPFVIYRIILGSIILFVAI